MSTKIHQLVDGNGLPLVTLITPGQAGDSPMFLPLMAQLRVGRETVTALTEIPHFNSEEFR